MQDIALISIAKVASTRFKKKTSKFEIICVGHSILHLAFFQKVSWNAIMNCRPHQAPVSLNAWSDDIHEEEYFYHLVLSLEFVSLLSTRVNADLEIFLGFFQLCTTLLATKSLSIEKIDFFEAIPFLLSELILLFSSEDLLRSPRSQMPTKLDSS